MDEQGEQQTKVIDEKFKNELLHELDGLRKSNFLCDTTVRAEGQDFPVHSCVLSAASQYFKALFGSELRVKENHNNFVELTELKSTIMAEVLQFIYTGEANINSSNAQDLILATDYLIVPSLKSKAAQFLEESINASNCLALESFAFQYNCDLLRQAATKYKCLHFVDVVTSQDFLSLGLEEVKELLCEDELNISEEEKVFEAIMSWVNHDLSDRECFLPDLLKCLRLFSMSKYSLRMILDTEELVTKNPICTEIIYKGLDFFLFPDRFLGMLLKHRISIKKEEHAVILTGGYNDDCSVSRDTYCFDLATKKWQSLEKIPSFCGPPVKNIAVCGGRLYAIGTPGKISIFNPKKNAWKSKNVEFPFELGGGFAMVSYNEELFYFDGMHVRLDQVTFEIRMSCDVYKYSPSCNEWKQLKSMETGRANHCAVVLKDLIYVIGGNDDQANLTSVECYNPSTDQWQEISHMANARTRAVAAVAQGKIVVVGGLCGTDHVNPTCEVFDPSINQWSLVSSPKVARIDCGIVSVDDIVYIFGGEHRINDNVSDILDSVECFDVKCNEWHDVEATMPKCIFGAGASLLRLPKMFLTGQDN